MKGDKIATIIFVTAVVGTLGFGVWYAFGSNWASKNFGRTISETVPAKVVNVTWKDESLWILHRAPREGEVSEVLTFQEYSNLGILQGKVVITEKFEVEKEPESVKELKEIQARQLAKLRHDLKEFEKGEK